MKLTNEFVVDAPVERVWSAIIDVERVAPCVPGARLLEGRDDDRFDIAMKVRVGPVTVEYRGDLEIVERDESKHHAVMKAALKEARGQGGAGARLEMNLDGDEHRAHGRIDADVSVTGQVASLGQSIIQDVATRIVGTFATNLSRMLEEQDEVSEGAQPDRIVEEGDAKTGGPPGPDDQRSRPAAPDVGGDRGHVHGGHADAELSLGPLVIDVARERLRGRLGLVSFFVIVVVIGVWLARHRLPRFLAA